MDKASKLLILLMFLTIQGIGQIQQHGNLYRHEDGAFEFTTWTANSAIVTDLPDVGSTSLPKVFELNGDYYLVAGEYNDDNVNPYKWNGTDWDFDNTIGTNLMTSPSFVDRAVVAVFKPGDTYYAVVGQGLGNFIGYEWNGSGWTSNSTVVNSLPDIGVNSAPEIFYYNSTYYLLAGNYAGTFAGETWNGSGWSFNSALNDGLGDIGAGSYPAIFQINDVLYLITGDDDGSFSGFEWNGTLWSSNSTIITGLVSESGRSAPTVFYMDGNLYLITGNSSGTFTGYIAE